MIEVANEFWKEVRCSKCRKLLAYEYIFNGRLLIKCPYCNEFVRVKYVTPPNLIKKLVSSGDGENPDNELVLKRDTTNPLNNLKQEEGGEKK